MTRQHKHTSYPITYHYSTMSLWGMLFTLIPFRAKKLVQKWAKLRDSVIRSIDVENVCGNVKIDVTLKNDAFSVMSIPFMATGISYSEAWENMLSVIAVFENMRNTDELIYWLNSK